MEISYSCRNEWSQACKNLLLFPNLIQKQYSSLMLTMDLKVLQLWNLLFYFNFNNTNDIIYKT